MAKLPISQVFGRVFPSARGYDAATRHFGRDVSTPVNTPIYSPAAGVVAQVNSLGVDRRGGIAVHIESASGRYRFIFRHLQEALVKVGASVRFGQIIGYTGATGERYNDKTNTWSPIPPHCHYEIKMNGNFINPDQIIDHKH